MTPYRDGPAPRTTVARPRAPTFLSIAGIGLLAAASVGLGLAAARHWTADPFTAGLGSFLCACGAAGVLVGKVVMRSGSAPCPGCGAPIHDVDRIGSVAGILCGHCGKFLRAERGELRPVAPDTVAEDPIFGAAVRESFAWPPGCAVCGAPSTRAVQARLRATNADAATDVGLAVVGVAMAATVGVGFLMRGEQRISIEVPHCAEHDDGAVLVDGAGDPGGLLWLFRSYPYQRAFCELNRGRAVESPDTGRAAEGG